MISKIIHYCWFGGAPLPKSAQRCIASWKKHFPDYEIKRWDESNFDVNSIPYTAQAYEAKKYAFVSDYARFKILYEHGGIYFDTDVEVVRPMDEIISMGSYMGIETPDGLVNPGLGMAFSQYDSLLKSILDYYSTLTFNLENIQTVVFHTTFVLKRYGYTPSNEVAKVMNTTIYPMEFFNPLDDATGRLRKTSNTYSIHWYSKSWLPEYGPIRQFLSRIYHRLIGM